MIETTQRHPSALKRLAELVDQWGVPAADITLSADGHLVDVSTSRGLNPGRAAHHWAEALGLAAEVLATEMADGEPALLVRARGHAEGFAFLVQGRVARGRSEA